VSPTEAVAARKHTPDLVRVACGLLKPADILRGLVDLGWNVNAKNGTTALHTAAGNGALETVQLLVALGADPAVTDDDFNATPAGWAEHFGHTDIHNYLEGLRP
jgi:ankyrin repeat protein